MPVANHSHCTEISPLVVNGLILSLSFFPVELLIQDGCCQNKLMYSVGGAVIACVLSHPLQPCVPVSLICTGVLITRSPSIPHERRLRLPSKARGQKSRVKDRLMILRWNKCMPVRGILLHVNTPCVHVHVYTVVYVFIYLFITFYNLLVLVELMKTW